MNQIITELKNLVANSNLPSFQIYLQYIYETEKDSDFDMSFVFQKVYLYACLKKKKDIADWMENIAFTYLSPIQQIAIRQLFSYGHYLLR